jgi:hypothetical protein
LWLSQLVVLPSLYAGNGVDNGGEYLSLEFTRLAREVYIALEKNSEQGLLSDSQMQLFDEAIKEIRVDAVNGPILDNAGRTVDARVIFDDRYEEQVIEIDRNNWKDFIFQRGRAHRLVFHEYLRVISVNDDNYVLSGKLEDEPFSSFLKVRAPSLSGTMLFEQLQQYFLISSVPDWGVIMGGSGTYRGRCFSSGDDRGHSLILKFWERDNGDVLDPSRMLNFSADGRPYRTDVLNETEGSLRAQNFGYRIRIYGNTLIISYLRTFCYAESYLTAS